jgi:hypothetical protein
MLEAGIELEVRVVDTYAPLFSEDPDHLNLADLIVMNVISLQHL